MNDSIILSIGGEIGRKNAVGMVLGGCGGVCVMVWVGVVVGFGEYTGWRVWEVGCWLCGGCGGCGVKGCGYCGCGLTETG